MSKVKVRPIALTDRAAWEKLWKGYVTFYKGKLPKDVTECVWWRMHDVASTIKGVVAVKDNRVIGIAHYALSPHTWSRNYVCYLEDLYVSPRARRQGAGEAIIEWLRSEAAQNNWQRVYWMTEGTNKSAQSLYDRTAKRTGWIRYDLDLSKSFKSKN